MTEHTTHSAAEPAEPAAASATAEPTLRLPADLDIEQAAALKALLTPHLAEPTPVTLDASDVARIHTAAMQLFCMFCSDRRSAGRETRWATPSPALRSAAALLGVTTLLQLSREHA